MAHSIMRNRCEVEPPLARLILGGRNELEVILDDADLARASELPGSWYAFVREGCLYAAGRLRRYDKDTHEQVVEDVLLHRWILRAGPDEIVTHRNGEGLDCRRANLEVRRLARPRIQRPWREADQRADAESSRAWFAELRRRLEGARFSTAQALAAVEAIRNGSYPPSKKMAAAIEKAVAAMRRDGVHWPVPPRAKLRSGWQDHLDTILPELRALDAQERIGREAVERIFRVSRATASRLLRDFGAERFGNVYVIGAGELLSRLERFRREPVIQGERERRQRVLAAIEEARRVHAARQVVLTAPAAPAPLPPGVDIRPGEIVIRFGTPEEAMESLLAIALQAQQDWEAFRAQLALS